VYLNPTKKTKLLLFGTVMLVTTPSAYSQNDVVIGYRQKVMQTQGANMGGIGDILKYGLPHLDNIAGHAQVIAISARMIESAFKEPVAEGPNDAKPNIWERWDEYLNYAKDLETASTELAEVAASGDMAAIIDRVNTVGDACKQCHDEFRKPREESYKRRQ